MLHSLVDSAQILKRKYVGDFFVFAICVCIDIYYIVYTIGVLDGFFAFLV